MIFPRCSIVITAYNAVDDIPPCIDGLLSQDYPDYEIILVDNASEDSTPEVARRYTSQIIYHRLDENRAITGGYNAGARIATGQILVFINADTIAQTGWLEALVRPLIDDPSIGVTTSKLLLYDRPHLVNTCGNNVTWTGLATCRGFEEPAENWTESGYVSAASGASLAIRRDHFNEIGEFDETIEFYYDDTDLSLRAQLGGQSVWYASDSHMYHRYTFKFNPHKAFYLERNRWLTMLKILSFPMLLLLMPGLLLGEVMAWVYSALKGPEYVRAKIRSWQWLWQNRQLIRELHRKAQSLRRVPERNLLQHWSARLSFTGTVPDAAARILEGVTTPILSGYGRLCQIIAIW